MQKEVVKEIEEITHQVGKLLVTIEPANPSEWDAMERLQAAHKQLRSIDPAELVERPPMAGLTR